MWSGCLLHLVLGSFWMSSVAQLCPNLWDPMDCSTLGFPVHHQLPEFTQTHVHRVSEANKPSQPLLSPSPSAFNLSQWQGLFSESALRIRWPKPWSFSFGISPPNEYSGLISFRIGWFEWTMFYCWNFLYNLESYKPGSLFLKRGQKYEVRYF